MRTSKMYALCRLGSDGSTKPLMIGADKKELKKYIKIISTPFDTCKYKVKPYSKSEGVLNA